MDFTRPSTPCLPASENLPLEWQSLGPGLGVLGLSVCTEVLFLGDFGPQSLG